MRLVAARSLGFVSEAVAWVFGRISGGHRHATHSFLGIAVFTAPGLGFLPLPGDWGGKAGLALLMTLSVSAALEALHVARGHVADLAGIAVAAARSGTGTACGSSPSPCSSAAPRTSPGTC